MQRIAHATRLVDGNGAGKDGFTGGSPATQVPATVIPSSWLNDVQEEICTVIEAASLTPDGSSRAQLSVAIALLINQAANAAVTAATNAGALARRHDLRSFAIRNSQRRTPAGSYAGTFYGACCVPATSSFPRTVIVGSGGEIEISTGGETWSKVSPAASYASNFRACCFQDAAGAYVFAVGDGGEIQYAQSLSTMTFSKATQAASYGGSFRGVTASPTVVVAVGTTGEIQSSSGPNAWQHRTVAGGYTGTWNAVRWCPFTAGGLFIAIGALGEVQTSPDGITWTKRTMPAAATGDLYAIAFGSDRAYIVGVGGIYYSFNGTSWALDSTVSAGGGLRAAAFSANLNAFVTAGVLLNGTVAYYDMETLPNDWTQLSTTGAANFTASAITSDEDGNAIIVGPNGLIRQTLGMAA